MNTAEELVSLLSLEKIEQNIFRGENYQAPWKRVFGGQVLAQSLYAAYQTVPEDRILHSMHGYFILAGDISMPILYEVDRIRDGGSFTTRRVNAIQNGKAIFSMGASFQAMQDGIDHQISMPNVPPPEALVSDLTLLEAFKDKAPEFYKNFSHPRPLEFRPVEKINPLKPQPQQPFRHVWIKANGILPDDLKLHQIILAYASDYNLLGTATLPHLDVIQLNNVFMASLDHAMWFHRDFRIDQWLLYALDSPSASNSRGFTRGNFFTEEGKLVASVVQEGLIRERK
ncbi:Acyl-CoA thioesterase 2 [Emticicia aquatica]|jgi:acyl-CoA thioesterase-2|uniref:Acyl-CoA thioesterase 2 n=1 Tax=Emticicia aquatica TaxID=1681835 RepID=A0ABM9APJ1_9BACT|nr:acyl-CoA thioesterase II [Emticicia aquatica]CAH0995197.1 Acyl-CoA thioesterase 2 [Emticicia aquatica]